MITAQKSDSHLRAKCIAIQTDNAQLSMTSLTDVSKRKSSLTHSLTHVMSSLTLLRFIGKQTISKMNILTAPRYGFLINQIFTQLRRTKCEVSNRNYNNGKHNQIHSN